jgi:hypothetical protein
MNRLLSLFALLAPAAALADPLPKAIPSAACTTPPTVDGSLAPDEWTQAKHFAFDLEMQSINPRARPPARPSCG